MRSPPADGDRSKGRSRDPSADASPQQLVGFRLGKQNYAFPIGQTREIVVVDSITPTPEIPTYFAGVSNLRGQIIPILDLHRLLGIEPPERVPVHAVVITVGDHLVGCLVDSVTRVIRLRGSDIQPADEVMELASGRGLAGRGAVAGFAHHLDEILIVLDAAGLMPSPN